MKALTLYAFSSQNWARPADEVAGLMDLLREYLLKERDEMMDNDIRLDAIGELDKLPKFVREPLENLRKETANNAHMMLTLALSYGGREELARAARSLATQVAAGKLDPEQLDAAALEKELWTAGLPALDLVVRTSGRAAHLELPALAARVRGALLHRPALARLPGQGVPRGGARVPEPRAALRQDLAAARVAVLMTEKNRNLLLRIGSAIVFLPSW